jgi:hypothetical protein
VAIRTSLLQAIERRCSEVEKIKFWPTNCAVATEHLWLAPFILLFQVRAITCFSSDSDEQGGTSKLVSVYRRTIDWRFPKVDEESYGNSVYRGYSDVCRQFTALLAVLSAANQSVSLAIAENSILIVPALISSLKAKDRALNQVMNDHYLSDLVI